MRQSSRKKPAFFFKGHDTPLHLSLCFFSYVHYLQETWWLLKQQFMARLLPRLSSLKPHRIKTALQFQHESFRGGEQCHLADLLLSRSWIEIETAHLLLKEAGASFFCCPSCKQHFQNDSYFHSKKPDCPMCNVSLQEAKASHSLLAKAMHADFMSPRFFSQGRNVSQAFFFLDPMDYVDQTIEAMETEIQWVLESCCHWINQAGLGPDKRFSMDIPQRGILPMAGHGKDTQISTSLFYGYSRELQELYWILTQKVFAQFCKTSGFLSEEQLSKAFELYRETCAKGSPLHLGEIMLISGWLDELRLSHLLQTMGYQLHRCPECDYKLVQLLDIHSPQSCPICRTNLERSFIEPHLVQNISQIECIQAIPLDVELLSPTPFSFFKAYGSYIPTFVLDEKEISEALNAFYRQSGFWVRCEIENQGKAGSGPFEEKRESLRSYSMDPRSSISREISRLMESIVSMASASDEAIYDHYLKLERSIAQTNSKNDVPPRSAAKWNQGAADVQKKGWEKISEQYVRFQTSLEKSPLGVERTNAQKGKKNRALNLLAYERKRPLWKEVGIASIITMACTLLLYYVFFDWERESIQPVSGSKKEGEKNRPIEASDPERGKPSPNGAPVHGNQGPERHGSGEMNPPLPERRASAEMPPELSSFLAQGPSEDEVVRRLMEWAPRKNRPNDVLFFAHLHEKYRHNERICMLCLWLASTIKSDKAGQWIDSLSHDPSYAKEIAQDLRNLSRIRSKEIVLEAFKEAKDDKLFEVCALALPHIDPDDETVYQALLLEFYDAKDNDLRHSVLNAISEMNVKGRRFFFEEVLSGMHYEYHLRKKSLDFLCRYAGLHQEQAEVCMFLRRLLQIEQDRKLCDQIFKSIQWLEK